VSEHEEQALAEAYALGALDPPERKLFEAHLGACRICRDAVGSAAVAANAVALTAPREAPPTGSGDRLMALYRQQRGAAVAPAPGSKLAGTAAVLFLLVAMGTGGACYHFFERAEELQAQVDDCQRKSILEAPDVQQLSLKPNGGFKSGETVVLYSPTKGVVVLAKALPEPAAGKVYKLWFLAGAKPMPMGTFRPGLSIQSSPGGVDTKFAISEESDPNATEPTAVVLLPA